MPEYFAVICCACAGARLRSAAAMAAAIIRMGSSLWDRKWRVVVLPDGRSRLTCLSINRQSKTPGASTGRSQTNRSIVESLGEREVARRLLATLGDDLEVDLLAFHQRAHAGALDGADMHEDVFRAVGRLDESEALLAVEELHGTCSHYGSPCVATPVNPAHADRATDKASEFWEMSSERPKSRA